MITIKYEEYENDYRRQKYQKNFLSLDDVEEWIFNQMETRYYSKDDGWCYMYWPVDRGENRNCSRISFTPTYRGPNIWIHQIDIDGGIAFTDGQYTTQQTHKNDEIETWFKHCRERQYTKQTYNFI